LTTTFANASVVTVKSDIDISTAECYIGYDFMSKEIPGIL